MQILELLGYTFVLYLILSIALIPCGYLLAERFLKLHSWRMKLLASFGFSSILYSSVLVLLIAPGLSNKIISNIFLLVIVLFFVIFCAEKHWRILLKKEFIQISILKYLFLSLTLLYSAFPDGDLRNIKAEQSMYLVMLPSDNIISYNFSRLLISRINLNLVDVTPNWKASDRGPLAALVNSVFFVLFGLEGGEFWMDSSSVLFFVYQFILSYLNILSLLAVWLIACEFLNKRAAAFSVILLSSTYFYFVNILFSWPKFYMAYFILLAIALWANQERRYWFIPGVFLGAAMLSHEMAAFSVAAFLALAFFTKLKEYRNLFPAIGNHFKVLLRLFRPILHMFLGFISLVGSWNLFKALYAPSSSRGIYFHLYCYQGQDVENVSLLSLAKDYIEQHSLIDSLLIRLGNLWYPFNFEYLFVEVFDRWSTPLYLINYIQPYIFFQFFPSLGVFFVILFFLGLFNNFKTLMPFFTVCFGSLFFAALTAGCEHATVNHVWAYPVFLVSALFAGAAVAKGGMLSAIFCGLSVGLSLVCAITYLIYHSILKVFLHASVLYFSSALVILALFICLCLYTSKDDSRKN